MILSTNHPIFTTSKDVEEIIKPLKQMGIVFFDYSRSDNDHGHTSLMTHPHVYKHYLEKKYYQIGNMESQPTKYKSQILLMNTLPNQHIYDDLIRSRNIDHGLQIIHKNENSCEFFSFAANRGNYSIANTYLNKLDVFKNFIMYFKDQAAALIRQVEKKRIFYPFHNEKLDILHCDHQDNEINMVSKPIMLSKRQLQIARELLNGKTVKEISQELNLSHRTIESYINHLKDKIQSRNRSELIVKLYKLFYSF